MGDGRIVMRFPRQLRAMVTFFVALALLLGPLTLRATANDPKYGDVIGPVTRTSMGLLLPTTRQQYDWLTPRQKADLEAKIYARLPEVVKLIEAGEIPFRIIAQAPARQTSSGRFNAPLQTHIPTEYGCAIGVSDTWDGSWMRGGGWTRTGYQYPWNIKVFGNFYKDGAKLEWFGANCQSNCTNAESWTSWWFKYWFEQRSWYVESWHNMIEPAGHYNLGPDQFCSVSRLY